MYNYYYRSCHSILPVLYIDYFSEKHQDFCFSEARQLLFSGCIHFQLVSLSRQTYTLSGFTALHLSFFFSSSVTQKKQKCEVLIRRIF